jgi:hypothetical protein
MHMGPIKILSISLSFIWAAGLMAISIGLIMRRITFWPNAPIVQIDYLLAVLCIALAFCVIRNNRIGLISSAMLFIGCAIFDGYGYIIRGDHRCWPGALIAGFGIVFMIVKYIEHRKRRTASET